MKENTLEVGIIVNSSLHKVLHTVLNVYVFSTLNMQEFSLIDVSDVKTARSETSYKHLNITYKQKWFQRKYSWSLCLHCIMLVLMFSLAILWKEKAIDGGREREKEGGGGLWCPRNGKQLGKNRVFRRDLSHSALALWRLNFSIICDENRQ